MKTKTDRDATVDTNPGVNKSDVLAEGLLERAVEARDEQAAFLEVTPLESQYQAAFLDLVEAKHDQAERIEDRLEALIEQQSARMQQSQAQRPGILSTPKTRTTWQLRQQQQMACLNRLRVRLEVVREIKEGMGLHAPRIEELAARKLRAQEPELASEWDGLREAQRLELQRKRGQVGAERQTNVRSLGLFRTPNV